MSRALTSVEVLPVDDRPSEPDGFRATVLSSGRAYALYQDNAAHLAGVASLTPPAACSG
jgi:hypothetical protein